MTPACRGPQDHRQPFLSRREVLKTALGGAAALGVPSLLLGAAPGGAAGPNAAVRVGIIGLGGIDVPGSVGGRGRQLIGLLRAVPGVTIAAIADVDRDVLDHSLADFQKRGAAVAAHTDLRKIIDDRSIDAVVVATPNHWHALATIWACQAGKDVYVEKPFSYNIWEGRQMVAAARRHGRMVQCGTQRRSSKVLHEAFAYVASGQIGPIRCGRAIIFRGRKGIGKVAEPSVVPASIDYDLWCGPAAKGPLRRKQLHYDWHWMWDTGNGEIGNNGAHMIDICRWGLGQNGTPRRVLSLGGRLGFDDDGQTANTQIAYFDFHPAPLICEIRNLGRAGSASLGKYRGQSSGVVIECEGGYFAGDMLGGALFDRQDRKIKTIADPHKQDAIQTAHMANFIAAVRSRRREELAAEAQVGHLSATCAHLANISYRLGKPTGPAGIDATVAASPELTEALARCREHLRANNIDPAVDRLTAGVWLTYDGKQECFVGERAAEANALCRRSDRQPFTVPAIA